MKTMKYLMMLLVMTVTSACMVGCSDDDEITDIAAHIEGDYSGTLNIMGYTDTYTAYVEVSRKATDAVAIVVDCDDLDMHLSPVILDITGEDGKYKLSSASKAVNGSIIGGDLSLTFSVGDDTFTFYGSK